MGILTNIKHSVAALVLIALLALAPSGFAAPPHGPPNAGNIPLGGGWFFQFLADYNYFWGHHGHMTQAEELHELLELQVDEIQLKALVTQTFFLLLDGRITTSDPAYAARLSAYIADIATVNADITSLNALITKGESAGVAALYARIQTELAGIVTVGNILFPPGVSLDS